MQRVGAKRRALLDECDPVQYVEIRGYMYIHMGTRRGECVYVQPRAKK